MHKKVLIINYFLSLGGGEKLVIELVDFCLRNEIQPEILITERVSPWDNTNKEHYDEYLKRKGVKVYRVPIFYKPRNFKLLQYFYWSLKLKYSSLFYHSIHIVNLNLCERIYKIARSRNRYFWHIVNRIQFRGRKYPYQQFLLQSSNDNVVVINKYQLIELREHFEIISSKILNFKLFINK
jgi:hypothetical protein